MSINKVMLIGNLGKDPEVRYLDNQKVVATFTLATNDNYTDRNGEKHTETEWHNLEMWDQLAKIAEKYLKKGSQIYVEGKIKTDTWKDKDGNERNSKKIRVIHLTLLGSRNHNDGNTDKNASAQSNNNTTEQDINNNSANVDDDLPF